MTNNTAIIPNALGAAQQADIRAIKPPFALPDPLTWLWIILGLVALTALGWWLGKKLSKKDAPIVPQIIIPPHIKARQRLQEAFSLMDQPQPFCFAVSDTIRAYLEERFRFHAPDRTTEEFLHELQGTEILLPDQKQSLGEFLSICDMVKFARYEPGRAELKELLDSANRLIDETEPQPEPNPDSTTPAK